MSNLNIKTELKFNWDDIEVGNLQLDNSQNFFAQKHSKHEKFINNNENIIEEVIKVEVKEEQVHDTDYFESNKENNESLNMQDLSHIINCLAAEAESDEKNKKISHSQELSLAAADETLMCENSLNLQDLSDIINCLAAETDSDEKNKKKSHSQELSLAATADTIMCEKNLNNSKLQPCKSLDDTYDLKSIQIENPVDDSCNETKENDNDNDNNVVSDVALLNITKDSDHDCISSKVCKTEATTTTVDKKLTKKNLLLEWSTHAAFKAGAHQATATAASAVATPKAYVFKDIYQQKREEALRKREDEERKLREFHSRPMPNFKACHLKIQRPVSHVVTCPKTPLTLKTWRTNMELRKQKLEKEQESQKQKSNEKVKPRSVAYLREEPFKPKLPEPTVVEQKPFRLCTEQRLQERREYDATVQRAHEDQKQQVEIEEEHRRKQEIEIIKEIRKMTEFKARPNPFQ